MKYIFACFCCFILSSCTTIPDKAYHKVECSNKNACSETELDDYIERFNAVTDMVIKNGQSAYKSNEVDVNDGDKLDKTSFSRFYLEYGEDGKKFEDDRQLELIKRAIDTSNKPVYLVVYAHGWNNNANTTEVDKNFDTAAFPYLLARRSFQNPDMNVIGVYLGWRGAKYKYRPAHFLTPSDRVHAADFIGEEGEVRDDLIDLTNHVEKSTHSGYSLIMGHSFGGRLLSRAFMDDLANTKSITDWPLGRKSLLANLNPAIGADAFDEIYSDMPGLGENLQRPLWINLTSEDDDSTKKTFPRARFILQDLSDKPYSGVNDTIGHYMPYLSHWVTAQNNDTIDYNSSMYKLNDCPTEQGTIETNWFEIPERKQIECKLNSYEGCVRRHQYQNKNSSLKHTVTLLPLCQSPQVKLGYMWNFRVDSSLIDHSETGKKPSGNGPHNAFVQTTLGRMLDDMLFTSPEKPLD